MILKSIFTDEKHYRNHNLSPTDAAKVSFLATILKYLPLQVLKDNQKIKLLKVTFHHKNEEVMRSLWGDIPDTQTKL